MPTWVKTGNIKGPKGDTGLTGPPGSAGTPGGIGPPGSPAWTLCQSFTVPAPGATVTVTVNDASWMTVGEVLWIGGAGPSGQAGPMKVQSIAGNNVTLLNVASSPGALNGDMTKAIYDVDNSGVVDRATLADTASAVDWTGVANKRIAQFYGADTTNNNAYAITVSSDFQLVVGVVVFLAITFANTGAPTLSVNGTGAKAIVNRAGIALSVGEISGYPNGRAVGLVYDGTNWRVFSPLTRIVGLTNPANPTVECAGYDAVHAYFGFTSASGAGITLAHVATGVPMEIVMVNATASPFAYYVNVTGPGGASAGRSYWLWSNSVNGAALVSIDSTGTLPSITNGLYIYLKGCINAGTVWFL